MSSTSHRAPSGRRREEISQSLHVNAQRTNPLAERGKVASTRVKNLFFTQAHESSIHTEEQLMQCVILSAVKESTIERLWRWRLMTPADAQEFYFAPVLTHQQRSNTNDD